MKPDTYQIMRQIEDDHWWFVARRRILQNLIGQLGLPPNPEILEVGCGTGGNIRMLMEFGNLTCIEYDGQAAELARERGLAPVFHGELPAKLPELPHQFDLVTALDVIEHIDDDRASLETLGALLKPGGRLLVTVPAFNFLWSVHDDENFHKRRYRKADLARLASHCGFRLDYLSYFNFWLFPPVAMVRLIRKALPYEEAWKDMRQPGPIVNRSLEFVFSSERFFVGKRSLPFGISLVAVMSPRPPTSRGDNPN